MNRILIIQTSFLGDVILATALVEDLHHRYPDASISMLIREGNESLLEGNPHLTRIHIWHKKESKIRDLLRIIREVRREKYNAVFNLHRFTSTGLVSLFSGASIRVGFDKNPLSFFYTHRVKHIIGDGRHEVDRNNELTRFLGEPQTRKPRLYPSPGDVAKTLSYKNEPYVVMAPASVWFTKQLPQEKWLELISRIPVHFCIYLIGAFSDFDLNEAILKKSSRKNVRNLAGELSLLQSASLMQDAKMNFVNDSGPMHLASSVNAPVTVFYCSTVPAFGFGPLSDTSQITETPEILNCRPCGLHGHKKCPMDHFKCALTIDISGVKIPE
jgi:heptosyltransferase II